MKYTAALFRRVRDPLIKPFTIKRSNGQENIIHTYLQVQSKTKLIRG